MFFFYSGNQSWWSVGSREHQNVPGSDKQVRPVSLADSCTYIIYI